MLKKIKKHKEEYGLGIASAIASALLYYFLKYAAAPLVKKIWVKDIKGLEHLPKKGPFIVASNHESYFDFLCFWAVSPHQIQYLAAEKFYDSKFWKPLMVATGQIKVERKSKDKGQVHKQAHYILQNKGVLGVFPEGTRSRSGEMGPAFTGVTRFALEAKVPIVPVGMIGTYDILPPHKKIPKLKRCRIKIEKPIVHAKHFDQEHTEDLLRHLTDNLMLRIAALAGKEYKHLSDNKEKIIQGGLVEGSKKKK